MTTRIVELVPSPSDLLALEPSELGPVLLQHLNSLPANERVQLHSQNVLSESLVREYPPNDHPELLQALAEAWAWLEREGLLVPRHGQLAQGWVTISRQGARLLTSADFTAFRHSSLLPHALLHPVLASKVSSAFIRGEYDTAIFQAFKEVEVAVREASSAAAADIGVALMRKAFDKASGPLTDPTAPEAEREAVSHLFAGAIGCFKNPQSHRRVSIEDPKEAVELLLLASHLLRIVDARRPAP